MLETKAVSGIFASHEKPACRLIAEPIMSCGLCGQGDGDADPSGEALCASRKSGKTMLAAFKLTSEALGAAAF